jgi:hypothetical protein
MADPIRVQLRRTKGWRMPPNTVSVARPGKFGNPFPVIPGIRDAASAVRAFRAVATGTPSLFRHGVLRVARGNHGRGEAALAELVAAIPALRGKNLACWCRLDQPCHADVLLELANPGEERERGHGEPVGAKGTQDHV